MNFHSGPFAVRPEWIDSNGHLNLAYYVLLFDRATDALWRSVGLGDAFRVTGFGTFAVEAHTFYRAELVEGETASVGSAFLGADGKRLHVAHEMTRTRDGAVSARQELMYLCVNLETRRVAPWPERMASRLRGRVEPAPDWIGGRIAIPAARPPEEAAATSSAPA